MTDLNPNLRSYSQQLADLVQRTWERNVRLDYENQALTAPNEDARDNLLMHLRYQDQGVYNYGRNYRLVETDTDYKIVYDCNVTGMPMIHCLVNKDTGDVARHVTELIEDAFFQFNLLDPRSRDTCYALAEFTGDYLS
jgi:hypothetical protein